jgi:hypothetical protein
MDIFVRLLRAEANDASIVDDGSTRPKVTPPFAPIMMRARGARCRAGSRQHFADARRRTIAAERTYAFDHSATTVDCPTTTNLGLPPTKLNDAATSATVQAPRAHWYAM